MRDDRRVPPADKIDEAGAMAAKRKMEAAQAEVARAQRDVEYWRGVYERYMGKGRFRGWDAKNAIREVLQDGSGMSEDDIVKIVVDEGGGYKPPKPGKGTRSPESNVRSAITALKNARELEEKRGLIYLKSP